MIKRFCFRNTKKYYPFPVINYNFDCKRYIMAKKPENHGKAWSNQELKQLMQLAKENTPTRLIGLKIGRTADAVQAKASDEGISLKPTNQSPYGTCK
jgi:hypothetical protein